jgi:WD40 repeat protein
MSWGCWANCSGPRELFVNGYSMSDISTGSTSSRLPLPDTGRSPAWSPDGDRIAFVISGDVFTMRGDGTHLLRLTRHFFFSDAADPAWSPDGTRIVFAGGPYGLFRVNADGSGGVTPLTSGSQPAWSPDGKKILFLRDGGAQSDLYLMNPDGTAQVRLTDTAAAGLSWLSGPAWSPDGRQIVFRANTAADRGLQHLFKINADGRGLTELTKANRDDYDPAWSPDGTRIAFEGFSHDTFTGDTYTIAPDGSGETKLPMDPSSDLGWQPCPNGCPADTTTTARARIQDAEAALAALKLTSAGARQWRANTLETLALLLQPDRWRVDGTLAPTDAGLVGMRLLRLAAGRLTWASPELRTAGIAERDQLVDAMNVLARLRFVEVTHAVKWDQLRWDPKTNANLAFLLWRAERRLDRGEAEPDRMQASNDYLDGWRTLLTQPSL